MRGFLSPLLLTFGFYLASLRFFFVLQWRAMRFSNSGKSLPSFIRPQLLSLSIPTGKPLRYDGPFSILKPYQQKAWASCWQQNILHVHSAVIVTPY
jgi:hypothetical protein